MLDKGLQALHAAYAKGTLTPLNVLDALVEQVQLPGALDCVFMTLTLDRARQAAQNSTRRWQQGRPLGPLDGVPVVWKDVFDISGTITSCGSRVLSDAEPAHQSAALVSQLEKMGALSIGKTTLSEFAYSGLGINPYPGTPRNPVDRAVARIPGGSSSGSAVAVSSGLVPLAMGSDTSGSIRIPAAFQGLVGFKPSHGRYDTKGMYPLAPSLDTAGPLVRNVADACLLDEVLTGVACEQPGPLSEWCFIVPCGEALAQASPQVQAVFDSFVLQLKNAGLTVETREFEPFELTRQVFNRYGTLVAVEASVVHAPLMRDQHRFSLVDTRIADRMRRGAVLPLEHQEVIESRRPSLVKMAKEQLSERKVLLYPTVAITAPEIAPLEQDADWFAKCNQLVLHNTMLGSYLDMPTLAMPVGLADDGLPVSVSLSMATGRDSLLLGVGVHLETLLQSR